MTRPLAIFDFDGVLLDSAPLLRRTFVDKLASLGYRFLEGPEDVEELFDENIADALISRGVTPDDLCSVWEAVQEAERREDIPLCRGIPEMLAALSAIATLAVVSSNGEETIRGLLAKHGVLARFAAISGIGEAMGKVQRIAECARSLGAALERTLYVGDSRGDMAEAREAGVMAVAASWGLQPASRLAEARPDCLVHEPSEIVDLVKALAGAA